MKHYIPNSISLINLFCGCCALVSILYGLFIEAFWFLFAGAAADFLDGMIARWLKVKSALGKELDSLADMVSFGVVPGMIIYMLLVGHDASGNVTFSLQLNAAPAFILTLFAALRLAKFNIDTRQAENFIGLPTPSCAMFTTGLMLIYHFDSFGLRDFVSNPYFLYGCVILFSYLLVSEIPMFSFKFTALKWKGNEIKFIFAAIAVSLLVLLQEAAVSFIVVIYILFTTTRYWWTRNDVKN